MSDPEVLMLAARYLEFAFYFAEADRLRALALAPIFCDESALEIIARYSTMLEEQWECDEVNLGMMEKIKVKALNELRSE